MWYSHLWVHISDLFLVPPSTSIPKELTHGVASPSPSPEPLWLSGRGLLAAKSMELPAPRDRLLHLVGIGGKAIRSLEDRLGVIIWVMDRSGEMALVLVVGHLDRLMVAKQVVEIVSLGARSLLDRLHRPPAPG